MVADPKDPGAPQWQRQIRANMEQTFHAHTPLGRAVQSPGHAVDPHHCAACEDATGAAVMAVNAALDHGDLFVQFGSPEPEPTANDLFKEAMEWEPYARLYEHLTSRHAVEFIEHPEWVALENLHQHEHDGPGTIRNHDRGDLRSQVQVDATRVASEAGEMPIPIDATTLGQMIEAQEKSPEDSVRHACPDDGTCGHYCTLVPDPDHIGLKRGLPCFRVLLAGPFTGTYPGDQWPLPMVRQHQQAHEDQREESLRPPGGEPVPNPEEV